MDFQKEYGILCSLNPKKILEISFNFNNYKVKLFFSNRINNKFLTLVCENNDFSFVKNYCIYFTNGNAKINGYWGNYYEYAKGLAEPTTFKYTEFYNKLREAIANVNNPTDEFKVIYHNETVGIRKIKTASDNSIAPKEPIYFHFIRRRPMRPKQYKKVTGVLGKDAADYLKRLNLTAVLTSDISKQKKFVLVPDDND